MSAILDLQARIGEINTANGWRTTDEATLEPKARVNAQITRLALITTEVAEAIEEIRNGRAADETYYPTAREPWEHAVTTGPRKAWGDEMDPPEGDGWELDESRGRLGWERFDYHEERYWRRRIEVGPFKPEGVPSELADIVIRALDAADAWGIDLGAVIEEKLAFNALRGYRHGGKTA